MAEDDCSYAHTPRPLARTMLFSLKDRELTVTNGLKTLNAPVKEITAVQLTFVPRNSLAKGFRMKLFFSNGRTAAMTNMNWKSLANMESQNIPYRSFVTRLIGEIGKANPRCLFTAGQPMILWLMLVATSAATMAGMVWLVLRAIQSGERGLALVMLLFGAYFAYTIGDMIRRNRPRQFTADAIPPDLLP